MPFFHTPDSSFSENESQQHISQHEFKPCHPHIAMASTSHSASNYCSKLTFKLSTRENLTSIYLYLQFTIPQPRTLFTSMEFVLFLNIVRMYFSERASFKNNFFIL
jgi:hypothetical protein